MPPKSPQCDICGQTFSSKGIGRHRAACEKREADRRADLESRGTARRLDRLGNINLS